jgi:hypothetical protein
MSRPTARLMAAALLACALALPATTASAATRPAPAKGCKAKPKAKKAKGCSKAKKKAVAAPTPVTVDLLDGSQATVDVAAIPLPGGVVLPGMPVTRTVPISGRLTGGIPGGYQLGRKNDIALTGGAIAPGPVDILSDAACGGAPALRLNPASNVVLDKAAPSMGAVFPDGRVTATVRVLLNLAFDSRTGTACDSGLTTMGWSPTALPVSLSGTVEKGTGLSRLTLDGPAVPVTVAVCLTPGEAGKPCGTPPLGYPVTIAVHAVVKIAVG